MATIIRDPLVKDNIVELNVATDEDRADIRRRYEDGQLILLRGFRYDLDFKFLNSLCFDVEGPPEFLRKLKKYGGDKIAHLSPTSDNPLDQFVFAAVFGSDAGLLGYYQEQVASGNAQCDALYASLFPSYRKTKQIYAFSFDAVDFIKIDVEGFEKKVLLGAARTIERCNPVIVIEQNHVVLDGDAQYSAKEYLETIGYRVAALDRRGWDFVMIRP